MLIPSDEVMAEFERFESGHIMEGFYLDFEHQQMQLAICNGVEVAD